MDVIRILANGDQGDIRLTVSFYPGFQPFITIQCPVKTAFQFPRSREQIMCLPQLPGPSQPLDLSSPSWTTQLHGLSQPPGSTALPQPQPP